MNMVETFEKNQQSFQYALQDYKWLTYYQVKHCKWTENLPN